MNVPFRIRHPKTQNRNPKLSIKQAAQQTQAALLEERGDWELAAVAHLQADAFTAAAAALGHSRRAGASEAAAAVSVASGTARGGGGGTRQGLMSGHRHSPGIIE